MCSHKWANPSLSFQYSHLFVVHVSVSLNLWVLELSKEQPSEVYGLVLLIPTVVRVITLFFIEMNILHKIIRNCKFIDQLCYKIEKIKVICCLFLGAI